ncbi:MAG: hypothetical protein K8I30_14600 [Anaerolineae bacterium]|nr:hypothetical protein [Anaerolineae bacterium]
MSALPIREVVIAKLSELSDEQVAEVLEFIQAVEVEHIQTEDDDHNPLLGFFSAPPDFAETSEEVLHREFGLNKPQDFTDQ